MVKTRMAMCATVALMVMCVLGSVYCTAEQSEAPAEAADTRVNRSAFQPEPQSLYVMVKILIHSTGNNTWTIKEVAPKGPDICNGMKWATCDGTQFLWVVIGHKLEEGERVVIKKASGSPSCFEWDEWVIEGPNNSAVFSGPSNCVSTPEQEKYGVFWPYDVEFYLAESSEPAATTDPRGIVH